jgi:hypothetical protein
VGDADLDLLATVLLPGDDLFPAAGSLGLGAILRERLAIVAGSDVTASLPTLAGLDGAGRIDAVAAFERSQPAVFEAFFKALCLTYYGRPEVTAAIAASGLPYHETLQPKGYAMEPFDQERDVPRAARGHWLRTDDVTAVALPAGIR